MKRVPGLLILLLLAAGTARAQSVAFIATGPTAEGLSPLNENPPHPESSGHGTALVTWNFVTHEMTVNVLFNGLTTPTTAAHIHCCVTPPGNAGVATTTPTFPGFPLGVTSGSYSHAFDVLSASTYNPAFVTANGGTAASAATTLINGMLAGRAYLNVHTTMFGGGEIRGFLNILADIEIKPGATAPVPINSRSRGFIPVAGISTTTFSTVTGVDQSTLRFGRTGTEDSLAFCNDNGEDVNGDGLLDLVCHFDAEKAGFRAGDTFGYVTGKTIQGFPFIGREAITVK